MANPQKENGFTPIAHEIIEALIRCNLTGLEWAHLMLILRESYGQNRKEAFLSFREMSDRIGCRREHSARTIKNLVLPRMVTPLPVAKDGNTIKKLYRFQKDFDGWGVAKRGTVAKRGNTSSAKRGNGTNKVVVKEEKRKHIYAIKKFFKPTPENVETYAKSIHFKLNGHQFCDYYESKGWKIGTAPMKSWEAAVRTWKRKYEEENPHGANGGEGYISVRDRLIAKKKAEGLRTVSPPRPLSARV